MSQSDTFLDVACDTLASNSLFAITASGVLCSIQIDTRMLDRWVRLESPYSCAISLSGQYLACACARGLIRLFDSSTLQYIVTLPRPPPLGQHLKKGEKIELIFFFFFLYSS